MTKVKVNRLLVALLAAVFFVGVSAVLLPVRADRVSTGSSAFTGLNNITVKSDKADGLSLTAKGRLGATEGVYSEATYANKLFAGNFSLKFRFNDNNFSDKFNVTLVSDPHHEAVGSVKNVENTVTFVKSSDAKWTISFKGVGLDGQVKEGATVNTTASSIAEVQVNYSAESKKLSILNGTAEIFAVNNVYVTNNVAQLKFSFNALKADETAELFITEINGQAFTGIDSSNRVDDNKAPHLVLNTNKTGSKEFADTNNITKIVPHIYMRQSVKNTVPVTAYDVISSSLTYEMIIEYKHNDKWVDAKKEIKELANSPAGTINGLNFTPYFAGEYRITSIKVKDGNGNSTSNFMQGTTVNADKPILLTVLPSSAFAEMTKPVVAKSTIAKTVIVEDTNLYKFAAPAVTISAPNGIDPALDMSIENQYTYNIKYKTATASSWSTTSGLVFNAKNVDYYSFYIEVVDRWGNKSEEPAATDIIEQVYFKDIVKPIIAINNFPETKYVNQAATLPTPVVTDAMDASPTRTIKVYFVKDADGKDVYKLDEKGEFVYEVDKDGEFVLDGNGEKIKVKDLVSESYSFTPEKLGKYEVVYSAKDKNNNETTLASYYLDVVEAPAAPKTPLIDTSNPWIIVSLCVAIASALGIVAVLFIPSKKD